MKETQGVLIQQQIPAVPPNSSNFPFKVAGLISWWYPNSTLHKREREGEREGGGGGGGNYIKLVQGWGCVLHLKGITNQKLKELKTNVLYE